MNFNLGAWSNKIYKIETSTSILSDLLKIGGLDIPHTYTQITPRTFTHLSVA